MKVDTLKTSDVVGLAAPYNPRVISDHDFHALRRSLREFGFVEPVVVNQRLGRIVGSHQRVKAAEAEGIEFVPVVYVDLDENAERQLNLALNRISGEWDDELLATVLRDLETGGADLTLTGFEAAEIEDLLRSLVEPDDADGDPDEVPDVPENPATRTGDVILLGRHRLLCGSATDPDSFPAVLGDGPGARADVLWTDPPYGVSYVGKTKDALTIENDGADGLAKLLADAFGNITPSLQAGAALYICAPPGPLLRPFLAGFVGAGWTLRQVLVWAKDQFVLGHSDYHYQHELILYGFTPGEGRRGRGGEGWYGDNAQGSVFPVDRPRASKDHPTMKPTDLIVRALQNSAPRRGVVLDPFAGSGSTLMACELLGMSCRAIELSPGYCDVIVKRWQDFTRKRAVGWRGNVDDACTA